MPQASFPDFVNRIRAGNILASFPTDTVPALASRPEDGELIYRAKNRTKDKPLILMAATLEDLLPYVQGTTTAIAHWQQVTDQYWPGALTLVLPASDRLPAAMNPGQTGLTAGMSDGTRRLPPIRTIGVRVPAHPLARQILSQTGPLATTSVNKSGQPPLMTLPEIRQQFPEVLTLSDEAIQSLMPPLGEASISGSGVPSTVIRWQKNQWELLRSGTVVPNLNSKLIFKH